MASLNTSQNQNQSQSGISSQTDTWANWLSAAKEKAKDFAGKAQDAVEIASNKIATSPTINTIIDKASIIQQKYQAEVSSSILQGVESQKLRGRKELDLTYITENLICMAYPADPQKKGNNYMDANDINAVSIHMLIKIIIVVF